MTVRPHSAARHRVPVARRAAGGALTGPLPDADGFLLPNLRMTPPFEFGFVAPANPANGIWPPDEVNPPLSVAGIAPLSCAAGRDNRGRRAALPAVLLRSGERRGRQLRHPLHGGRGTEPRRQARLAVRRARRRAAAAPGAGHWELPHHPRARPLPRHRRARALPVTDAEQGRARGRRTTGEKLGYSPADQHFADWDRFVQADPNTSGIRRQLRPGDEPAAGPLRAAGETCTGGSGPATTSSSATTPTASTSCGSTADPLDVVLESRTDDNVAYALHPGGRRDDIDGARAGPRPVTPGIPISVVMPSRFGPDLPSSRAPAPS
jgi:hypothetical protein